MSALEQFEKFCGEWEFGSEENVEALCNHMGKCCNLFML